MCAPWPSCRLFLALLLLPISFSAAADERPSITLDRLKLLADDVKSGTPGLRVKAARELALIGPGARPAIPALRAALKARDGEVRMEAALALLQIDQTQGKEALTAIRNLFQDEATAPLAILVLPRLRDLRPMKKEVAAGLIELSRDKHPLAPVAAWMALDNLGPGADDCATVLQEALKDPQPGIRVRAAAGLVRIDSKHGAGVEPVLLQLLDDAKLEAAGRLRAAMALLAIDPRHRQRVGKVLTAALSDPDVSARLETAELLLRTAPDQVEQPLAAITGVLREKDREQRLRAIDLLVRLGLPAREAETALRALVKDADAVVAGRAVEAVMRLRPEEGRELFPLLLRNRDRTGQEGVLEVFKVLEELRKLEATDLDDRQRLKSLTEQLRRPPKGKFADLMRLDAAIRLAVLGAKAQDATADLALALDDPWSLVRSQALHALRQIGPAAGKAVPRLIDFCNDRQQPLDLQRAAGEALKGIAPNKAGELGIR